ncbi:hypothetical protein NKH77_51870 [Streptomyces sp. M19]
MLDELYERERRINWETYAHHPDPRQHAETGFSLSPEQGDQLYLLVRHGRARHVVEFATSLGFSTLFSLPLYGTAAVEGVHRRTRAGEGSAGA